MKLIVVGSGSGGNCYILETATESLIIEAGVRFDKVKNALQWNLRKVVGCLVTHEHGDHCKAVTQVMGAGIAVYASPGTHTAMGTITHHKARMLHNRTSIDIGGFYVMGFDVRHDVKEPFGFLIYHKECGVTLFLTDTKYSPYKFKGLNNIIIEANYDQKILDKRGVTKESPQFLNDRVINSHMNIDNCLDVLRCNDLTNVNHIVLIHLSDRNSNAKDFKTRVENVTGKTVSVADAGLIIRNFDLSPF